jgi:hypothetical protein
MCTDSVLVELSEGRCCLLVCSALCFAGMFVGKGERVRRQRCSRAANFWSKKWGLLNSVTLFSSTPPWGGGFTGRSNGVYLRLALGGTEPGSAAEDPVRGYLCGFASPGLFAPGMPVCVLGCRPLVPNSRVHGVSLRH